MAVAWRVRTGVFVGANLLTAVGAEGVEERNGSELSSEQAAAKTTSSRRNSSARFHISTLK